MSIKMFKETYKQIDQKIRESSSIAVISHKSQDGDGIWSTTAFYEIILENFTNKKIDIFNSDPKSECLSFLPNYEKIQNNFKFDNYDLIIMVDIASLKLSGFWNDKESFSDKFIINIDHHFSNHNYWDINLVDPSKPSATAVLYDFFDFMWYKINKNAATCLLTWIYTDTGSFIYSNVTPDTFKVSSHLMKKWWDVEAINYKFFSNNSFQFMKLYARALERLVIRKNYALSYIKNEDILELWWTQDDLGGIVSRLNEMSDVDYICFLHEKWDITKCSLRTQKEDVDLTLIAGEFWWWWHKKASAFAIEWKIMTERDKIFIFTDDGEKIYF